MEEGGSTVKKRGGLFVLLAILLSLLPPATQATLAAAPGDRLVVQLSENLAYEAAAAVVVPQAIQASRSSPEAYTGEGTAGSVPAGWILLPPLGPFGDHSLPPSTASPGSTSTDAYKARAPPVR